MNATGRSRQELTPVHDVLSLFRDKTVHDVMNSDNYQNKNSKKALAEALEAYNLSPIMEETINCYGSLLAACGSINEGKSVLMQGLESNPESVPLHYNLGVAYNREHDQKKSLEEFKKVYKFKPTLRHAIQLLLLYQQRYAVLYTLIVITTLFGSLIFRVRILLLNATRSLTRKRHMIADTWKR
jgi:tetratricopeptide (TPR) repeat protein